MKKRNLKISMIMTARMGFRNKPKNEIMNDAIKKCNDWKYAEKLKIPIELIDCSNKANLEKFKKSINSSQIIWVMGGDTLYLWYHLKKTKMDELIKKEYKIIMYYMLDVVLEQLLQVIQYIQHLHHDLIVKQKYYRKNTYKKVLE